MVHHHRRNFPDRDRSHSRLSPAAVYGKNYLKNDSDSKELHHPCSYRPAEDRLHTGVPVHMKPVCCFLLRNMHCYCRLLHCHCGSPENSTGRQQFQLLILTVRPVPTQALLSDLCAGNHIRERLHRLVFPGNMPASFPASASACVREAPGGLCKPEFSPQLNFLYQDITRHHEMIY